MKNWKTLTTALLISTLFLAGCGDEGTVPDPDDPKTEAPALTKKVNLFIKEVMNDIYLWYDEVPNIDYKYEFDSKTYFNKLIYKDDKWSDITDDVEALENSYQGTEKTFGWSLTFGLFSDTENVFAIVQYVYPNSPAANAGVKRGDLVIYMNGSDITQSNYTDLLYADDLSVTLATYNESTGITLGATVEMIALELSLNPVLKTNIIEYEGHKIGYLFYSQYVDGFDTALDTALESMVSQGMTDLVLDLRYNRGGTNGAAQHLCSSLAPLNIVNSESTFYTFLFNDKYQSYNYGVPFDKDVPVKLGLDNIHILTGNNTASASELTITGLRAYMEVTLVGDTTYGKFYSATLIKPETWYDNNTQYYQEIANWAVQPIFARFANSQGVTDFKDGFPPDIDAYDDIFNTLPLGDMNDPLLAAAIEDITGSTVISAVKSARKPPFEYKIIDQGFSRFDKNKEVLHIDINDINF
ncbi:S41 family peptidase [Maribellus mangrovi]|uniref:S41 family peptidase n=1 Tax=Maribellus mangrovi TaxID=3133146 RepID=UPI0030EB712E